MISALFPAWLRRLARNQIRYLAMLLWIIIVVVPINAPSSRAAPPTLAIRLLPDQIHKPRELLNINGTLFFVTQANELWRSDGTAAGTVRLRESIGQSTNIAMPGQITNVNGTLFFSGSGELNTDFTLWKSDGTPTGTLPVTSMNQPHLPDRLTNVNGMLFFSASDATGRALWKSDGTAQATQIVIRKAIGELINASGTLFFTAADINGNELWKSDGTTAGTSLIVRLPSGLPVASFAWLTNVNGALFFVTERPGEATILWKTDGSSAGTVPLREFPEGAYPAYLTDVNGVLFFSANDGLHGDELWKSDGTPAGTTLVKDIFPGSGAGISDGAGNSLPRWLANVNGILFFSATDGAHGMELWKSDGTITGTQLVKDISVGSSDAGPKLVGPDSLTPIGAGVRLLFAADDGASGMELWQTNGTEQGTVQVQDIVPGNAGSFPHAITIVGSQIFFAANGSLWVMNQAMLGAPVAKASSLRLYDATPATGLLPAVDLEGDPLTYQIIRNSTKGVAMITNPATGAFVYTPNPDAKGTDSFSFWVNDGSQNSGEATVTVTICGACIYVPLMSFSHFP